MKNLLICLILVASNAVSAKTQISRLVDYIQSKYSVQKKEYPILIFDKDELNWRFARARAFGEENEKLRIKLIQEYVKEQTDLQITSNEASQYEVYLTILSASAVALPILRGDWNNQKYAMCAVFHADPNSNQRLETERILQLRTQGAYSTSSFDRLKLRLDYETMKKFSLYHELGHCMDPHFMPKTYRTHDDSHGVHQSESFAETMGLFFLAKEGINNVAQDRAKLRSLYSRGMGEWFVKNPQNSFGNPHYKYGGIIYYLEPVLRAGGQRLRQNPALADADLNTLIKESRQIVEQNAIQPRAFHAIYTAFSEGVDSARETYTRYEQDMPDLFAGVLESMMNYLTQTSEVMAEAFENDSIQPPLAPALMDFSVQDFCPAFLNGDQAAFENRLQQLRDDLQLDSGEPEEQRQRQKDLQSLYFRVSTEC